MTITEIIARLGHACGLPWADCRGLFSRHPLDGGGVASCGLERGHRELSCRSADGDDWWPRSGTPLPTTLAEWAAEWEREHPGEPGPVAVPRRADPQSGGRSALPLEL